jgi:hypothetical protein
VKKDETIKVTSGISLSQLLDIVRSKGRVRLEDGGEVFVVERVSDRLSEDARDFLVRGGTVESD